MAFIKSNNVIFVKHIPCVFLPLLPEEGKERKSEGGIRNVGRSEGEGEEGGMKRREEIGSSFLRVPVSLTTGIHPLT